MTWRYDQSSGELTHNGKFISRGYSGHQLGKNNPLLEGKVATGPLPRGMWKIGGPPYNSANVGPYALHLSPVGHDARALSPWILKADRPWASCPTGDRWRA